MNYYLDCEFHEYHKQPKICGMKVGKPIPTTDLISIGIVSDDRELMKSPYKDIDGNEILEGMYVKGIVDHVGESKVFFDHGSWQPFSYLDDFDGSHYQITDTPREMKCVERSREYYAVSKDFNIKDAWNSWQWAIKVYYTGMRKIEVKEYWLRDNVLKPIFKELLQKEYGASYKQEQIIHTGFKINSKFDYKNFKYLIAKYGKTNKQIAKEIKKFTGITFKYTPYTPDSSNINFYAYYADYDWVVFCQLFGKMNDLPKGFPMYCKDLKQEVDNLYISDGKQKQSNVTDEDYRNKFLLEVGYPKQDNEHNALSDAIWNKELHKFIKIQL